MSGLGDFAQKAERYAKDNPDKVEQGVEGGEKFADEHTGHRYDQQRQEGAQPDGGQRQEQTQEDAQNDDQDANHS